MIFYYYLYTHGLCAFTVCLSGSYRHEVPKQIDAERTFAKGKIDITLWYLCKRGWVGVQCMRETPSCPCLEQEMASGSWRCTGEPAHETSWKVCPHLIRTRIRNTVTRWVVMLVNISWSDEHVAPIYILNSILFGMLWRLEWEPKVAGSRCSCPTVRTPLLMYVCPYEC